MHCPRCGQQQVSIEIKFCSRCGFPLSLVSEVLANGGFLPQLADLYKTKTKYTKKNGVMFSVFWFIFFVFILTPFGGILNNDELAGMSAITGIFGGLMILIGSLVFLKSSNDLNAPFNPNNVSQPNTIGGANQYNSLPPQQSIPVSEYVPPSAGMWRDTNDLQKVGSVTEGTTKLLEKE